MWNERISNLIEKINYVTNQENINRDIEFQNQLKNKVLELNKAVNQQLELYLLSNEKLAFIHSDETMKLISSFIEAINEQLNAKKFDKSRVKNINKLRNNLEASISDNWDIFYYDYTYDTISLLNTFKDVIPDKINILLTDIKNAQSWNTITLDKITKLDKSLKESMSIISSVNSDPKITAFLTKVNSGIATFSDIDQDIADWIREENLSNRISIKFM